ncbi:DUF3616 domain-containing protein [Corallococcus macrosporus]|uniref:DUF3616 domain-containing protein n=1 Tax=Corallococcus macrosporus DSM 14697 TaxID=1189310 RepID=A0A250JXI4_9BACT|nr:DUF3616 domain-containing protein [Corallococcus macrosporus]ATB48197.1 hypothetical protein MYMAC_003823 [Corallococcus macrosporus DSM 14697]
MRLLPVCMGLLVWGCSAQGVGARRAPEAAAAVDGREVLVFEGMCDASGAVALGGNLFVVGDDEDNILRVYDARRGGPPVRSVDLSPDLQLPAAKKKAPETDIEAATGLGSLSFWLTSHGRNSSGKKAPSRLRFFATEDAEAGPRLVGRPYTRLLDDLLAAPRLARFGLEAAETKAPKAPGGLNIEGMTAMPDGRSILVGFRSPVPEGKALLVPLLNPVALVEEGARARLGEPVQLDLGGLGIRSLSWWRGRYLIISGGTAGEGTSRLFTWRGGEDAPVSVESVDLAGLNPEAFFTPEDAEEILLLSDDGTAPVDGVACKRLKDASRKRFRGVWVRLPGTP